MTLILAKNHKLCSAKERSDLIIMLYKNVLLQSAKGLKFQKFMFFEQNYCMYKYIYPHTFLSLHAFSLFQCSFTWKPLLKL